MFANYDLNSGGHIKIEATFNSGSSWYTWLDTSAGIDRLTNEKDDSDLVSKINEMGPQIYILAKGYLETFEQHYYEKDNQTESKSVEYDDVEELFN